MRQRGRRSHSFYCMTQSSTLSRRDLNTMLCPRSQCDGAIHLYRFHHQFPATECRSGEGSELDEHYSFQSTRKSSVCTPCEVPSPEIIVKWFSTNTVSKGKPFEALSVTQTNIVMSTSTVCHHQKEDERVKEKHPIAALVNFMWSYSIIRRECQCAVANF